MKIWVTTLFLLFFLPTVAQMTTPSYTLKMGPQMKGRRSFVKRVLGTNDKGIYILRQEKSQLFIELIGKNAEVMQSVPVQEERTPETGTVAQVTAGFILNNRLFLQFTAISSGKGIAVNFIEEYDPRTLLRIAAISRETVDMNGLKSIYVSVKRAARAARELSEKGLKISRNRKYLIMYSSAFVDNEKADEQVFIRIYDANMDMLWENEFTLPYKGSLLKIRGIEVDEYGNAHMIASERQSTGNDKSRIVHHVISFLDKGTVVKDKVLELDPFSFTDVGMIPTSDGNLMLCGFYSNGKQREVDGVFGIKMNARSHEIIHTSHQDFESDFLTLYKSERQQKRDKRLESRERHNVEYDYDLDRIVTDDDGNVTLFAEQYYEEIDIYTVSNGSGSTTTKTRVVYHGNDIIVVRYNTAGDLEWKLKVPKQQASVIFIYVSFRMMHCGNDFLVLYNDRMENHGVLPEGKGLETYTGPGKKSNVLAVSTISSEGEQRVEVLKTGDRKGNLDFVPWFSGQFADCEGLLSFRKGKTYQYGVLQKAGK